MRQLASFLLFTLALSAAASETWRWKDENGVVHYSDRPVPGAERIDVSPAQSPGGATTAQAQPVAPIPQAQPPAVPFSYSKCLVVAPANDEVFNAVSSVNAALQVLPGLQPGHRLQVIFDEKIYLAWPSNALGSALLEINRGTHTLTMQVLDASGRSLCASPVVTFHIRQPSVLAPGRQPRPRP